MKLKLIQIRTDGGTQSRAQRDESATADYALALQAGAVLPPVTVFFDGTEYWLADGFHRYFANKRIDRLEIESDIHEGGVRDARLFGLCANQPHGLRRTNEDKRHAVLLLLEDAEWSTWSDRRIAEQLGLSVTFVSATRRPEVAQQRQENRQASVERQAAVAEEGCSPATPEPSAERPQDHGPTADNGDAANDACSPTTPAKLEKPAVPASAGNGDQWQAESELEAARVENIDLRDRLNELADNLVDTVAENESMTRVFNAEDKIGAALVEAKRFREQVRILNERVNGLMNEKNEYIRLVKYWKRRAEKAEKISGKAAA
jgi:hypothetical protein